jgi:hypothetical protein
MHSNPNSHAFERPSGFRSTSFIATCQVFLYARYVKSPQGERIAEATRYPESEMREKGRSAD